MELPNLNLQPPMQTSDWCICILCNARIGITDIAHMESDVHQWRASKDTSGVPKYIISTPRPLYRETQLAYPTEYMPTCEEVIELYEKYQSMQPKCYGAALPLSSPFTASINTPLNTTTLQHERIETTNVNNNYNTDNTDSKNYRLILPANAAEAEAALIDEVLLKRILEESAAEHLNMQSSKEIESEQDEIRRNYEESLKQNLYTSKWSEDIDDGCDYSYNSDYMSKYTDEYDSD